jgi:hypothetical protein
MQYSESQTSIQVLSSNVGIISYLLQELISVGNGVYAILRFPSLDY